MNRDSALATTPPAALEEAAARIDRLLAMFSNLDERGQVTTLALLATAVKLHPRVPA